MKKIITALLSNFTVITSASALMANQVTSQEIDNMRTKVDFWIEKTKNWENYVAKEFRFDKYYNEYYFFTENQLDPNNRELGYMKDLPFLHNYTVNPNQPINERKWFNYELTYYAYKAIDLKCHVQSGTGGRVIKEFEMNDFLITKPENQDALPPNDRHNKHDFKNANKIIIRTILNNADLYVEILFFYPTHLERIDKEIYYNNWQRYFVTSNHSSSNKINIKLSGTLIYKLRDSTIQKLHNKLLAIKEQLNDPNLAEDAYRSNLSFMNLES